MSIPKLLVIAVIALVIFGPNELPKLASEYFRQNCYMGVSQPGPDDVDAMDVVGVDRFLWGSDFPFAREKTLLPQIAALGSLDIGADTLSSIENGTATRLMPRLATR